ncbi:hypothetical protein CAEBREN_12512 [Caenorhabditis brenneri]|uniref:Uncharacterized protein n=1 Tax=Caenorhabditis brenneri TaxID=135651 RepID=G0NS75_CAEBE|nr:hypothetical protein CAEBREN_12512 [Caenorhabditis brenneri]
MHLARPAAVREKARCSMPIYEDRKIVTLIDHRKGTRTIDSETPKGCDCSTDRNRSSLCIGSLRQQNEQKQQQEGWILDRGSLYHTNRVYETELSCLKVSYVKNVPQQLNQILGIQYSNCPIRPTGKRSEALSFFPYISRFPELLEDYKHAMEDQRESSNAATDAEGEAGTP